MAVDGSYRTFALIAACLSAVHLVIPLITSYPRCSDDFTFFAPSAMLFSLGTFYSGVFLVWVYTSTPSDLFEYEENNSSHMKTRESRNKPAEDVRYMTSLWMAFGATGILSNDLIWAARFIATHARSAGSFLYPIWIFWALLSGIAAVFVTFALGHLLSMGAEAGIEAAETMLRRVEKVTAKTKMQ